MITIEEKLEAVKRIKNGEILRTVAADFGVGVSTVSDWVKMKNKFEEHASKMPNKKTMKTCQNDKVNEAVFLWFTQQREKGVTLSGPVIQEKAKMLSGLMGEEGEGFKASAGWLEKWKNRYGVRQVNVCGEKLSADVDAADIFKTEMHEFMQGYSKDQIFNADETGLNFKMLPKKSLASRNEKSAPGHKMNKQRVTVLLCSNASGTHRLRPMCIGKSKKPRALKDISANALPVFYRNQKSSWMSTALFTEWFSDEFVPSVESFLKSKNLPRKAVLLIDNAPTHPQSLQDGDIIVQFLPANVTSLIQPLDQGVIECFKRHYRSLFLRSILQETNESKSVPEILKSINMKHVVYWCAQSWEKIKSSTLEKCWNKLFDGILIEDDTEKDENLADLIVNIPGCEEINKCEISEWVNGDDSELDFNDQDIIDMVLHESQDNNAADDEDDDVAENTRHDTADEVFNAFEVRV